MLQGLVCIKPYSVYCISYEVYYCRPNIALSCSRDFVCITSENLGVPVPIFHAV